MAAASSKLYVALEEMNGNVFAKSTFNVQKEISCEFDAELLPDGNFRVHAWLEDDSIGKTCETIKLLRVLPYKSNQVYPGKDRFLRVKGEPFFQLAYILIQMPRIFLNSGKPGSIRFCFTHPMVKYLIRYCNF